MTTIVQRPRDFLPGEQLVAVDPPLAPNVEAGWRRRLHLFAGRALSHLALTAEQQGRDGILATTGQYLTPGIVSGLEAELVSIDAGYAVHLSPGYGVAPTGEDVLVPRPHRVLLEDLPVYGGLELIRAQLGEDEARRAAGTLPSLGDLRKKSVRTASVFVLVIQPVSIDESGVFDPTDPCEHDPAEYAFEDRQRVDAARLWLYPWPDTLPSVDPAGPRARNELAYAVFRAEQALPAGGLLPWETLGVALGLIGLPFVMVIDPGPIIPPIGDVLQPEMPAPVGPTLGGPSTGLGRPGVVRPGVLGPGIRVPPIRREPPFVAKPFLDRNAVARRGGTASTRVPLLPGAGTARLWQARFEQFAEHVADVAPSLLAGSGLASRFATLPPIGVLPPGILGVRSDGELPLDRVFPRAFAVEAVPVPLEELDDVLRKAAPLDPIDLAGEEQVQILVPVPQAWYDPKLLVVEGPPAAEFDDAIALQRYRLNDRIAHRDAIRAAFSLANRALTGKPAAFDPDPEPVIPATLPAGHDPAVEALPPEPDFGGAVKSTLTSLASTLRRALGDADTGPAARLGALIFDHTTAIAAGDPPVAAPDLNDFNGTGLPELIRRLKSLIDQANDRLDFGFLRIHTDAYRIRQHVVGNVAGTRFATSSVLSQLARAVIAAPTTDKISAFADALKHPAAISDSDRKKTSIPPIRFDRAELRMRAGVGAVVPSIMDALDAQPAAEATATATVAGRAAMPGLMAAFRVPTTDDGPPPPVHFGTATITDRLEVPPAPEAQESSQQSKAHVVNGLIAIHEGGIDLTGLRFPGFDSQGAGIDIVQMKDPAQLTKIRNGEFDKVDRSDEAAFFATGVKSLEDAIASMRLVEARIQQYEDAKRACEAALQTLRGLETQMTPRLRVLANDIDEQRRQVAVAVALKAEEQARLDALNARRQQIVDEHVPYLVFRRPRVVDAIAPFPMRAVEPGGFVDPVPAALARRSEAPDQLRAMVDLLRDAPVSWFPPLAAAVDKLNRVEALHQTLHEAVQRARIPPPEIRRPFAINAFGTPAGQRIQGIYLAQKTAFEAVRTLRAGFDVSAVAPTWKGARQQVDDVVTVADLIQARHGRPDAAKLASAELENVYRVSAALFDRFRDVPPIVRLRWEEHVGDQTTRTDLHRLSDLPSWGQLDRLDRLAMQAMVDWLFQRIDPGRPNAVALVDDLVRVAILLASHAEVNQILAGDVIHPEPVSPGGRVHLSIDASLVRVGMHVLLFGQDASGTPVGRGVIDDIGDGTAQVRVIGTTGNAAVSPRRAHVVEPSDVVAAGGTISVGPATVFAR
jgi:hypothetical protein